LAKQSREILPDEHFSYGPIEYARFGKNIVTRNNMTQKQHEEFISRAASKLPEIEQEIDEKISRIVGLVTRLPSSEVLKRAYWEMATNFLCKDEDERETNDGVVSLRMVDYIQSIIASVHCPIEDSNDEVNQNSMRFFFNGS
jgi:hypothetical protein